MFQTECEEEADLSQVVSEFNMILVCFDHGKVFFTHTHTHTYTKIEVFSLLNIWSLLFLS